VYLRFVVPQVDEDSRRSKGLFTKAHELLNSGSLAFGDGARVRHTLDWFNDNLPPPPKKFFAGRAIFWFKSRGSKTRECIDRMWDLTYLIREYGHHVEVHKCRELANICFEDDFQVAAYPSARDSRTTVS
jgi:hypothetical protein